MSIIDDLVVLPSTIASDDELPVERGRRTYKINYEALATAILSKVGGTIIPIAHGGHGANNADEARHNLGAVGEDDLEALQDAIEDSIESSFEGSVHITPQTLLSPQQQQARENIDAAGLSQAVRYDAAQSLTDAQKTQALNNIGAAPSSLDAVKYGTAQSLTDAQKVQARENIDAASTDLALGAYPVGNASGAVASFDDGADGLPVKALTVDIQPLQRGSGDPSPENVREIIGWDKVRLTCCNQNFARFDPDYNGASGALYDVSWSINNGSITFDGTLSSNSSKMLFYNIGQKNATPAEQYDGIIYLPKNVLLDVYTGNYNVILQIMGINDKSGTGRTLIAAGDSTHAYATLDDAYNYYYCRIVIRGNASFNNDVVVPTICIAGATKTEPSIGDVYNIAFPSAAGTVYGGTLNTITGTLRATWANIASYAGESLPGRWISSMDVYSPGATPTTGAQVVYELTTPQTYQLTPTQIATLLGNNSIFADCGNVSVAYRADLILYIQKINAPTDDDMIADAQIASSKYFIVGGNLYRSTTTIPAGDAINPGSNCILTNLADALNALNT